MPYGLLTTGFAPAPLEAIREEINESLRTAFGASIDLSDESLLGHIAGIMAERLAALWEVAEQVNANQDPDAAGGTGLEALCALTGTFRRDPSPSTVTLTLTGTATTVVGVGSQAATLSTAAVFETTEAGTLVALAAWATGTAYALGDRRTNASRAYVCITAGTSAGSGGPTTTGDDITDNTVHWRYMGEGTAAADVDAECTENGPTVAVSGDITEIVTPVGGWSSVINLLDADEGQGDESDQNLRLRRVAELSSAGEGTPGALRAALLQVPDVTSVTIFYNDTDVTDADGVPPHAVEALVRGGDDQDIFDALFANVAAGVATHGTEAGTVTDSEGTTHDVEFTRPDEIDIYVVIDIEYDADEYPADGDDQVKAAIVAHGDTYATGRNVRASAVGSAAFGVAGVLGADVTGIGIAPAPGTTTPITIALRELAVFDTSRITVNSSAVTP